MIAPTGTEDGISPYPAGPPAAEVRADGAESG